MKAVSLAFVAAASFATAGCATGAMTSDMEFSRRIDSALSELVGDCGAAFASDQRNYRDLYGPPICREQRRRPNYRDEVRYDAAGGIGYFGAVGSCGSTIGGVSAKFFDAALTEYMRREGFYEADVNYILTCGKAECNGVSHCDGAPSRRDFYRPSDRLRVIAAFGDRNYPRVHWLGVEQDLEDHPCADPERSVGCFPPGQPHY